MAFEDLLENWEKFNLTVDEEVIEVEVDRHAAAVTSKSLEFNLIRKLLCPRVISDDVMRRNFKAAWNIPNGLTVEKLGVNLFLFSLRSEEEQTRILKQEPWLFDKFILVLSKPIPMVKAQAMDFKMVTFWVHFFELPMDLYNSAMVERLGNALGNFVDYDNGGRRHGWKESIRVRVQIDISKTLRRGIKVKLDEPLGSCWSLIRYKKLPELCSFCGIIGHTAHNCSSFYMDSGSSSQRHQYGMWLQYTGRTTSFFRSLSTSPMGQNKIMADIADGGDGTQVVATGSISRKNDGSDGGVLEAQQQGSGTMPMEISPAMEDAVTFPLMAINPSSYDGNNGAGNADSSRVKKKLDFADVANSPITAQLQPPNQQLAVFQTTAQVDNKPIFKPLSAGPNTSNGPGLYSLNGFNL